MNRLLEYLPDLYREIIEFIQLTSTGAQEVITAEQAADLMFRDHFVVTASEQAVKRREKMLGIQADPTSETLDFRRKRLINRYSTKPPFTVRYLQQRLDFLVGTGLTIVSVDPQAFILTVTTNIDNAPLFKEVERTIRVIKPANMLYQQQTSLQDTIELRERIKARSVSWNYKLNGSWMLGEKSFADLGMEVVYK